MSDGSGMKKDDRFKDWRITLSYVTNSSLPRDIPSHMISETTYISNAFLIYDAFEFADEVSRDGTYTVYWYDRLDLSVMK